MTRNWSDSHFGLFLPRNAAWILIGGLLDLRGGLHEEWGAEAGEKESMYVPGTEHRSPGIFYKRNQENNSVLHPMYAILVSNPLCFGKMSVSALQKFATSHNRKAFEFIFGVL